MWVVILYRLRNITECYRQSYTYHYYQRGSVLRFCFTLNLLYFCNLLNRRGWVKCEKLFISLITGHLVRFHKKTSKKILIDIFRTIKSDIDFSFFFSWVEGLDNYLFLKYYPAKCYPLRFVHCHHPNRFSLVQ